MGGAALGREEPLRGTAIGAASFPTKRTNAESCTVVDVTGALDVSGVADEGVDMAAAGAAEEAAVEEAELLDSVDRTPVSMRAVSYTHLTLPTSDLV